MVIAVREFFHVFPMLLTFPYSWSVLLMLLHKRFQRLGFTCGYIVLDVVAAGSETSKSSVIWIPTSLA